MSVLPVLKSHEPVDPAVVSRVTETRFHANLDGHVYLYSVCNHS